MKLPYIKWRDGRPRVVHSPRERSRGFKDRDLRHDDRLGDGRGHWYTYEEAREFSATHHAEIIAARIVNKRVTPAAPLRAGTVEDLLDDWLASKEVQGLKPASVTSYRKGARAVIFRPETRAEAKDRRAKERAAAVLGVAVPEREREPFATVPPAAIGAPELRDFFNYLRDARGHHMALAAIATVSAAFTWGRESSKWRLQRNPRLEMEFERPAGRVVLIALDEFHALVAAADAMGRASIGDAIYLGLFTGQRQNDRLAMKDNGIVNGRRQLLQSKTGMIVAIKEAPQLAGRLVQAKVRVAKLKVKLGLRDMPAEIVIDETTGRPYVADTYRHVFADVRAFAIAGSAQHGLAPCPTLAFTDERSGGIDYKHDQDLRDTCVILLDRAGCDLLTICDITGHSYQSAQTIMKHYRARNAERADTGIDRLVAFIGQHQSSNR